MAPHVLEHLIRQYGLPEGLFRRYRLVEHREDVFITTPEADDFDAVRPVRKGIRLARVFAHGVKPTTNAMQLFGRYATKNVLDIEGAQVTSFIRGEPLELAAAVDEGFVIVRHDGFSLGVGHCKHGILRSLVPLSRRPRH